MSLSLDYPMKSNGMYILSKEDMESIAAMFLGKYLPDALQSPQAIDIDYILTECLALDVKYRTITLNGSILGISTFDDVDIDIYDSMMNPVSEHFKDGTVIIDSKLNTQDQIYRGRFTKGHEGMHRVLHRTYHDPMRQQYRFRKVSPYIACRTNENEYQMDGYRSEDDWEEWQADSLTAAILMPYDAFKCAVCRIFHMYDMPRNYVFEDNRSVKRSIVNELSKLFEVSHRAIELRMKQLSFIRLRPCIY
jgi:Zn-dependent peptidase ImmA (M78 family)